MAGLTMADAWNLFDVEQQLVATGRAAAKDAAVAPLISAGLVVNLAPGLFGLTDRGWYAAHRFRRHVAANREAGVIPPFEAPQPPEEAEEQRELARDMYAMAMSATPQTPPPAAATADQCIQAAGVFINRRKAAGL